MAEAGAVAAGGGGGAEPLLIRGGGQGMGVSRRMVRRSSQRASSVAGS